MKRILSNLEIGPICDRLHQAGKTISFTNGCFDIIHRGHLTYLKAAAALADVFVIGLNSDQSVARLKGANRPVIAEEDRALLLSELRFVDYVCLFEEDTPLGLIKKVRPDILVKGGDYRRDQVVGKEFVESYGGRLKIIPFVGAYSTSAILNKIIKLG